MAQTKYTDGSGVSEIWANIKNYITAQLLGKSNVGHTHTKSQITDFPSYGATANTICEGNDSRLSDARTPTAHTHTKSEITDFPSLSTVATSGSYSDLSNKPTIPTVNNATLTIQKNGTTVKTFTANASSNVTANITVPTKTSDLTNDSGFLTSHQDLSGYVPKSGGAVITGSLFRNINTSMMILGGGNGVRTGACLYLYGLDSETRSGEVSIVARQSNGNGLVLSLKPDGTAMWGTKNLAMKEDVIPRSGGAVMTGNEFARTNTTSTFALCGGTNSNNGGNIILYGNLYGNAIGNDDNPYRGAIGLYALTSSNTYKAMFLQPSGTWTWNGTAVQLVSDQRLKQQISEIDDKLLDAWEDVELSQFKYNDAVDQKGDNARLHTGYVVQQIDNACQKHGVDISAYGLYCHEEYPEETKEVEVEQADGTKTKETKVIREASEHYSLRYTEVYAVECMYLRRCIARLTARIEELEKGDKEAGK